MHLFSSTKPVAMAAVAAALCAVTFTEASAQSHRRCDAYARDYAHRATAGGPVGGAVRGGIGGAIGGALLGGILGGRKRIGRGAAIGAGVGVLGGAVHGDIERRRAYRFAYDDCMRGSVRPISGRPAAWTPEWYDYCASRFRSFNPDTGRYRTYGGQYKLCR